jgi:hypothetical protein
VRVMSVETEPLFFGGEYCAPPEVKVRSPVSEASVVHVTPITPPLPATFHETVSVPVHEVAPVFVITRAALNVDEGFAAKADVAAIARTTTTTLRAVNHRRIRPPLIAVRFQGTREPPILHLSATDV